MYTGASSKEYCTKDIGEAAAFLCKKVNFIELRKDTNIYWFAFSDTEEICEELSKKYWFGELSVNAKTFDEKRRVLVQQIKN